MKRLLMVGLSLLVVAFLFALLVREQTGSNELTLDERDLVNADAEASDDTQGESDRTLDATTDQAPITTALQHPSAPDDSRFATVLRLADGDSFDIVWADTGAFDEVRLFGVNAPEGDACFGNEARTVLADLTQDRTLQIEMLQRDEFGRVLGNVWVDDVFVNALLVEQGAALKLSDGGRHAGLIEQSQDTARTTFAGLWDSEACGVGPAFELAIAWIEPDAPGQDHLNKNGEWIAIVNDGETRADMTDWSIRDESTRHRFRFPDGFVLAPNAEVRVFSGCGDDREDELYWCNEDPVWNNGGDTGFLVDPDGRFVDTRSY